MIRETSRYTRSETRYHYKTLVRTLRGQISGAAQRSELADHQGRARNAFSQGTMGRFPADEPVVREPQTLCREPDEDVPRYRPPRGGDLWLQAGQFDVEQFRPRQDALAAQQRLCRTPDPARPEERREGKEGGRTCRHRWSRDH